MPARRRRAPRRPRSPSFFRRRSTPWLVGAVVLLAVALVLGAIARDGAGDDARPPATATPRRPFLASDLPVATTTATPAPSLALPDLRPDPALLERAEVEEIIDGDTIDVRMGGRGERVRYYGIDTPERGDRCFSEASARNEALAGDTVLLLPDARERDRYGRLLRYVFDEQGRSIDAQLIAEGLARAWLDDGAYRDQLIALEGRAAADGVGCLWAP